MSLAADDFLVILESLEPLLLPAPGPMAQFYRRVFTRSCKRGVDFSRRVLHASEQIMSKNEEVGTNLEDVISGIEKAYGDGAVMRLGKAPIKPIPVVSTGSLAIDLALGVGGFPRGRVIEIYGPESGGKTTLTLHCIAEVQRLGGQAAFIDAEHALDPTYAKKLGVDTDNLLISQPDNGEQALEITEALIKSGKIDIVVVDSVAALVPKAELEGEMGDPQMGLQARLMSQALRKLTGVTNQTHTILCFINQIREKIGVMFGNPETTTGGRALKFYSSVRVDIRKIQALKNGDVVYGADTKVKIVKNKVASPFKEAQVQIIYGEGISSEADLIRIGEANRVIEKSGSWYSYKGERLGQGFDGARRFLLEHLEIRSKIDKDLRALLFTKG